MREPDHNTNELLVLDAITAGRMASVAEEYDELRFAFQPIFDLHIGGVVAVEALARPKPGTINDVFRAAAKAHRITVVDLQLAEAAVACANEIDTPVPLHVNLLATTVGKTSHLSDCLLTALGETGRHPGEVVLEIGPPFFTVSPGELLNGIEHLRASGFQIAWDGVGDGDIPLRFLVESGAGTLKLDRSLVVGSGKSRAYCDLVESMAQFAMSIETRLVAEGVETAEQLAVMHELGVSLVQGDLLAKPHRHPELEASIKALEPIEPTLAG